MNRRLVLFLILNCLATTICAQGQTPNLLLEAAHCLATERQDWLGLAHSKTNVLSLGYLLDTKSFPGVNTVYVVVYTAPGRSDGTVFDITVTRQNRAKIVNIENNAEFVKSKKGIDYVDPPLGGIWTQEHLTAAIKRIERHPRFAVRVKDLLAPRTLTRCKSYAGNESTP
jgi:hypothetical protein